MTTQHMADLVPEWLPFRDAVHARRPEDGTACRAWTVRDVVAHNAGNAAELRRILSAHLEGGPVPATRSFEEREPRFRNLRDDDLDRALEREMERLAEVLAAALDADGEALVPWTGRQMKVKAFGEHMREELILHRWDVVGDDPTGDRLLDQPWLTDHSVWAVGAPLLRRGQRQLAEEALGAAWPVVGEPEGAVGPVAPVSGDPDGAVGPVAPVSGDPDGAVGPVGPVGGEPEVPVGPVGGEPEVPVGPVVFRLRASSRQDVVVVVGPDRASITQAPADGPAVIESDPGSRVLLLWGRQPTDPGRLRSQAGPAVLGQARLALSGY